MRRLIVVAVSAGVLAGVGFYVNQPKPQPQPQPNPLAETVAELVSPSAIEETRIAEPISAKPQPPAQPAPTPIISRPITPSAVAPMNSGIDASIVSRAVDALVSPQASHQEKRAAWKQLRDAGKLDQAITDLEKRMADDPRAAEYPAALGQAYLQKCGTLKDVREQGILAMQADKAFDTALGLDPSNWEARFTKAVGMSYWPPVLNKGDEVIQHFQTLIEQQEAQPAQPHFAETYSWLGDQYQKAGRADDARTVWQRGAAIFPADEKLRAKLSATP